MDADSAADESAYLRTAKSWVLTPRRWRQVGGGDSTAKVARKPGHLGEHEISRLNHRVRECRVIPVRPW